MKKTLKILFLVGLLLFIVGIVGTIYYTFFNQQSKVHYDKIEKKFDTSQIKSLHIEAKGKDVEFTTGNQLKIEGAFTDKKNAIQAKQHQQQLNINIKGNDAVEPRINVNPFKDVERHKVLITIPKSKSDELSLKSAKSAMNIEQLNINKLSVDTDSGSIVINHSQIDTLNAQIGSGFIESESTDYKEILIHNRLGHTDLSDVPIDIPITIENEKGGVEVTYKTQPRNTRFDIQNRYGNVDLEDIENLKHKQVGEGQHRVVIKNKTGYVTFSTDD
ncbi:DUF4097 family beta strand repeat-containing protein [Staphylococcus schleiferi]|uniref:DUF4097 family beta strand repeat-containing protein n=1 Tax=Staphylococcus schleiferi TaxID=1295 RepID=UPI0024806C42|nr:DUF4097 family beta strand repeat-containing protein [Staphylococcus schleiferi]